jgi:hypothetical protein
MENIEAIEAVWTGPVHPTLILSLFVKNMIYSACESSSNTSIFCLALKVVERKTASESSLTMSDSAAE